MRFLAAVAACLFFANWPASACSTVVVLNVQPSSQHVRITALQNEAPLRDAKIAVFTMDEQLRLSVSTNDHGVAVLPPLSPGRYRIAATATGGLGADLILDVSKRSGHKTSSFSMNLAVKPPPPSTLEDLLAAAEKGPVDRDAQAFAGVVLDPVGGVISHAQIAVYQHESTGKAQPVKLTADEKGRFSTPLGPATYTAVFQSSGFRTKFFNFTISPEGSAEELLVELQLGSTCG